jgi:hypothetical protein
MIRLHRKKNRIKLNLKAIPMGRDLCVFITGGEAHIGAVTSASKTKEPETTRFDTHKEYHVTQMAADILRQEFDGNFTVCCGIHLDAIEKQEIQDVMDMSEQMIHDLCGRLKERVG